MFYFYATLVAHNILCLRIGFVYIKLRVEFGDSSCSSWFGR